MGVIKHRSKSDFSSILISSLRSRSTVIYDSVDDFLFVALTWIVVTKRWIDFDGHRVR